MEKQTTITTHEDFPGVEFTNKEISQVDFCKKTFQKSPRITVLLNDGSLDQVLIGGKRFVLDSEKNYRRALKKKKQ